MIEAPEPPSNLDQYKKLKRIQRQLVAQDVVSLRSFKEVKSIEKELLERMGKIKS